MTLERRLAAILAADVVGHSRLTYEDEEGTLFAFQKLPEDFVEPLIAEHHGRIVKVMGDGYLVEFKSAVDAVQCAVAWQQGVPEAQNPKALTLHIGVNLGDIVGRSCSSLVANRGSARKGIALMMDRVVWLS